MSNPIISPTFLSLSEKLVEDTMRDTRRITFDAVMELCQDIANFNGTAGDCVLAIEAFRRRIEESHH